MTPEQRRAICQIRLERADETLQDANLLFNGNRWRSAMNRIYYAMHPVALKRKLHLIDC